MWGLRERDSVLSQFRQGVVMLFAYTVTPQLVES